MASPALKAALRQQQFVIAPGVFDLISAKVADHSGFGVGALLDVDVIAGRIEAAVAGEGVLT